MIERDLRRWLKKVWGGGLLWTEAARGGTVGLPDVTIPLRFDLPVELKVWSRTSKGIRCEVRPAQIRYHRKSAAQKRRTAFLIAVDEGDDGPVFAFPGYQVPIEPYPTRLSLFWVGTLKTPPAEARERLVAILEDENFWGTNVLDSSLCESRVHV
jgi:hypothetical protein